MSQAQGQQNGKHNVANLKRACSLAYHFKVIFSLKDMGLERAVKM